MEAADKARVLVVDDDTMLVGLIAESLRLDGYEVETATDGVQALAMAAARQPHGVLLDLDMPGMDGFELVERLRDRYQDDVVLVVMTGLTTDRRVEAVMARVDHHLKKPVDLQALKKVFRQTRPL